MWWGFLCLLWFVVCCFAILITRYLLICVCLILMVCCLLWVTVCIVNLLFCIWLVFCFLAVYVGCCGTAFNLLSDRFVSGFGVEWFLFAYVGWVFCLSWFVVINIGCAWCFALPGFDVFRFNYDGLWNMVIVRMGVGLFVGVCFVCSLLGWYSCFTWLSVWFYLVLFCYCCLLICLLDDKCLRSVGC